VSTSDAPGGRVPRSDTPGGRFPPSGAPGGRLPQPGRRAALACLGGVPAAFVSGCARVLRPAAPPGAAPARWSGRIAVRIEATMDTTAARAFSASFALEGDAGTGSLVLDGPLGARLAEARWQPEGATLTDAGGERRFADLASLATAVFGEALPLHALPDWLRGRPWPGAPATAAPSGFEQAGFGVQVEGSPPRRIVASRPAPAGVTLRIVLDEVPAR
jgi:outer membrane lipoprotein LolB